MSKFIVGVMGTGENASREAMRHAHDLGKLIAQEGWVVLSGGRDAGVMKAVNEGAKEIAGSITVGILPSAQAKASPNIDIAIITDMGNARNNINVLSSHVVVACGNGSAGTASEIALAIKAKKPVILLDTDEITLRFFQKLGDVLSAQTPPEVVEIIKRNKLDPSS